jgi:hypothetical protein
MYITNVRFNDREEYLNNFLNNNGKLMTELEIRIKIDPAEKDFLESNFKKYSSRDLQIDIIELLLKIQKWHLFKNIKEDSIDDIIRKAYPQLFI